MLLESGKNKSKVNCFNEFHCDNLLMFIALCEFYITNDIIDTEVCVPGFTIARCDRFDRTGGGVCIYVRETILFVINMLSMLLFTHYLMIVIMVALPQLNYSTVYAVVITLYYIIYIFLY